MFFLLNRKKPSTSNGNNLSGMVSKFSSKMDEIVESIDGVERAMRSTTYSITDRLGIIELKLKEIMSQLDKPKGQ